MQQKYFTKNILSLTGVSLNFKIKWEYFLANSGIEAFLKFQLFLWCFFLFFIRTKLLLEGALSKYSKTNLVKHPGFSLGTFSEKLKVLAQHL